MERLNEQQLELNLETPEDVFIPPVGYIARNGAYNRILAREKEGRKLSKAEEAFKQEMHNEYAEEDRQSRSRNHGG